LKLTIICPKNKKVDSEKLVNIEQYLSTFSIYIPIISLPYP